MYKLCALVLAIAGSVAAQTNAPASDDKAKSIAETMMKAMGGQDAWMRAHFVRFDFRVNAGGKLVADRAHLWDKHTGRYRLEMSNKEGKPVIALFNVSNQQGVAYVDGKKLEDAEAAEVLKNAYGAFINDMYWLAMPWKWLDPGVRLKYLGNRKRGADAYDVVELTFGKVGLTPGDRYLAYVSPRSNLMEYWEYTLQNGQKGAWTWEYVTTEGVKLASNHVAPDGRTINMGQVRISSTSDETLFTDPAKKLRN